MIQTLIGLASRKACESPEPSGRSSQSCQCWETMIAVMALYVPLYSVLASLQKEASSM
jgi:hypothetical protein